MMTRQPQAPRATPDKGTRPGRPSESPPTGKAPPTSKVPPEAENFEHTIRRIIQERDRKRHEHDGLYL